MVKARNDQHTADMFKVIESPVIVEGSMQIAAEVCGVLNTMIEAATKAGVIRNRYDLGARMSELTGVEITKAQIDAWTGASKTSWRFPFEYAPAFEIACNSNGLQELFARKRGTRVAVAEDTLLEELGRIHASREELKQREQEIKSAIRVRRNK